MDDGNLREEWPLWVRVALWGLPNRNSAWVFFWLSLAIGVGCIAYGFVDRRFFLGDPMLLAALWYYLSIRWVDQNSRWSQLADAKPSDATDGAA